MKISLLASLLVSGLALVPTWPQGPEKKHKEEPETELGKHMESIEDTLKVLRKNLKDSATYPQALEALVQIEQHSLASKMLTPAATEKQPDAERATFAKAYRRTMVDFLTRQLELEAALLDGNAEAVKGAFERLREMEDSSHERFAPEDD
jgi:soluble cytochrome b562